MNGFQSQRLWKSTRTNKTRTDSNKTRVEVTHERRARSSRKGDVQSPICKPSNSHFNSCHSHGQHEKRGHHGSLHPHSITKTTPNRAHTSLGFTQQGPPHFSSKHSSQLKSQSSRQISSHPHTSSRKSLRAHSSLGFTWQGPPHHDCSLQAPRGFDIARYVHQQGGGSEIRIGVNGRESQDEYLLTFVRECKKQASMEDGDMHEEVWSGDEDYDVIMMSSDSGKDVGSEKDVPLCWDDQLKKAEPSAVRNTTPSGHNTFRNRPTVTHSRYKPRNNLDSHHQLSFKNQDTILHTLLQHTATVSVMATWEHSSCLLESTSLEELREGKMTYIPQPPQDDGSGWSQSDVSMATMRPHQGVQSVDDVWSTHGRDCIGDLVHSLLRVAPELSLENLLCVWLGATHSEIKELSSLDFDIFLTGTSTQVLSRVKAVNLSESRAVIPLSVESRELLVAKEGGRMTLCVMCGNPRSILFSVCLKHPPLSSTLTVQESCPTASPRHYEEGEEITTQTESTRFFKRRSYVSPDEDEDKTDMEALVKVFPDLMLLDLVDHEATPTILSPVHQHVERLNSMTTTTSKEEEPLSLNSLMNLQSVKAHSVLMCAGDRRHEGKPLSSTITVATEPINESSSSMATQLTSEPLSSTSINYNPINIPTSEPTSCHKLEYTHGNHGDRTNSRPLYRSQQDHHKSRTSTRPKRSFVSIAEHWLGPYL